MERLKKLEAKGVIRDYVALIDPFAVDRALLAFVAVRTSEHGSGMPTAVALARMPEVLEVHHVAGDDCYLLKVRARDTEHLGQFLRQQVATQASVISTRTTVVLESVKDDPRIEIPQAEEQREPHVTLAYLAWVAVCLIWGTTYLAIRVALETIPVLLLAGLRWFAAGAMLSLLVVSAGRRLPGPGQWGGLVLLGILMNVLGNGLVVWAERFVASGLTAVVIATVPFWSIIVEAVLPHGERFSHRALAGLSIGFIGIVVLVWPELTMGGVGGRTFVAGVVALQLACASWAIGTSYTKRHKAGADPFSASALQMLFSGSLLLCLGTIHGEWASLSFTPRTAGALIYLTVAGSLVAYTAYVYALKHLPLSTVSLYAYVNPMIAVVLGTLLLDEPFSSRIVLAAALVLVGMWVVNK